MAAKSELVDRTCTSPVLPNPRNGNTQLVSIQQQSLTMTRNGPATPRPVETTASFKVSDVHGNPIHAFVTPVSDLAPTAPLEQPRIVLQDNVIQSMVQLELEEVENEIKFSGNCPTVPASTKPRRPADSGTSLPVAGITVQGQAFQCVVSNKVTSKAGISFTSGV